MRTVYKMFLLALLGLALAACNKPTGGKADDGQVLATVNGTPITNGDFRAFVRVQANGQEPELNPMQRANILKTMVNIELMTQAARKAGFDKRPETQADLQISGNSLLAQDFIEDYLKQHAPTDAELKAAYDERMKGTDMHQYKARHILVKDETQAKDIIAQLGKGANFAKLAKKYSIDKMSAKDGGELGDWFSTERMVPEFTAALAKLKKGEITQQPVHTQYGFHVIQLEDVREQTPPTLDQMREQLANDMQRKTFEAYLKQLTDSAKVVYPAPAAASAPAPAAATTK